MYLNPAHYPGYLELLRSHHIVEIEAYVMDSSRNKLFNISKDIVSGVLDIDTDNGDASRFGSMTVLDPQQRLGIDLNGAGWGSNMSNRMLAIDYRIWNMERTQTFMSPIFTGPITDAARDGVLLNLEFKGLEFLLKDGMVNDFSWPPGWPRSAIIMDAVTITTGEVFFQDWSGGNSVLGQQMFGGWSVEAGEDLWGRIQDLAEGGALNVWFNGAGVLKIVPKGEVPLITFDSNWLLEEPDLNLDISKLRNVVRVEGAVIPGFDHRVWHEAWPPAHHPFSPQSLARRGRLRILPHVIKDDSLTVWDEAIHTARNTLAYDLLAAETITAVIPVVPFLEEYDPIIIYHPKVWTTSPLVKATIPLVGDATMSFNMLSTTSTGSSAGGHEVGGMGTYGNQAGDGEPSTDRLIKKHGPSGAFNTLGGRGGRTRGPKYELESNNSGKGGKGKGRNSGKKNRDRKGGKGGKGQRGRK